MWLPCHLKLFSKQPQLSISQYWFRQWPVTSFTKEVNPRLAKRPLVFNGRLANRGLTSLIKGATGVEQATDHYPNKWLLISLTLLYVIRYWIGECFVKWVELGSGFDVLWWDLTKKFFISVTSNWVRWRLKSPWFADALPLVSPGPPFINMV